MKVLVAIFSETDVWKSRAGTSSGCRSRLPTTPSRWPGPGGHGARGGGRRHGVLPRLRGGVVKAAPRLRWIHSSAAGVGSLLSPELTARGIVLTNSRGVHGDVIAEHVVGVTIMAFHKLHVAVRRQAEGVWARREISADPPIRLLRGATVGIVGLGAVGAAVARAAAALGASVVAIRRRPERGATAGVAWLGGPADLDELLARADVVVLAAPLTASTRALIGARELARMKPGALLVNVGRGKLVAEADLVDALQRGAIAGAALDVVEHEPLDPQSPLWRLPNVILTPHTAGFRGDYWDVVSDLFAENLARFDRGEPLLNVVDTEAG